MGLALHLDAAVMGFDDPGADGQSQSGAFLCMGAGIVGAVEAIEDPLLIIGRNSDPLIGNRDLGLIGFGKERNLYGAAGPRVLDGVIDEIEKEFAQSQLVA